MLILADAFAALLPFDDAESDVADVSADDVVYVFVLVVVV